MLQQEIQNLRSLGPLLLPGIIDFGRLDDVEDYDDYALLTFSLAQPMAIEDVLDDMEDQMELNVLYYMIRSVQTDAGRHCCAYANPSFGHMYKLNAQTAVSGKVEKVYAYVYSSLEIMLESLKEDLEEHSRYGTLAMNMELPRLIADFM